MDGSARRELAAGFTRCRLWRAGRGRARPRSWLGAHDWSRRGPQGRRGGRARRDARQGPPWARARGGLPAGARLVSAACPRPGRRGLACWLARAAGRSGGELVAGCRVRAGQLARGLGRAAGADQRHGDDAQGERRDRHDGCSAGSPVFARAALHLRDAARGSTARGVACTATGGAVRPVVDGLRSGIAVAGQLLEEVVAARHRFSAVVVGSRISGAAPPGVWGRALGPHAR